ncbi:hypothetical protein, conserved [Eimeria praecox]|uniref:Uncharacterized protein n=1 Tax=Eimeria praecox TaxID=51316 RepID=U6G594_9EIME|nr:hypothetical protein, conserved [Eimeria praecox]
MSGSTRSCAREGDPSRQLHESRSMGEASDNAWLLWEAMMLATALDAQRNTNIRRLVQTWEAMMLATALDAQRNTNIRRDFPDFGPWAFSTWTEEEKPQDSDVRLFVGLCFRLLSLLGCQMPPLDYNNIEAAGEAIQASISQIQLPDSISAVKVLRAPGRQHSLIIYGLLHKLAKKCRLCFAPPVYPSEFTAVAMTDAANPHEANEIDAPGGTLASSETATCTNPEINEGELLQAEERLWSISTMGSDGSHCAGPGVRWRQHHRALKSKQAELQCHIRKLRTVLPGLAEEARRIIGELKSKGEEVRDAFPDLFRDLEDVLRRRAVQEERQQQLRDEIQSLSKVLEASEERVKEATESLAAATRLRVSSQPSTSLASAELKQLDVRAAILRHAAVQVQPDPAAEAAEDAEEIPTLD